MKSRDSRIRDQLLAAGSQFEGLLSEVTVTLDDVDTDELSAAIPETLREIATFFHADGAFLLDAGACGAADARDASDPPGAAGRDRDEHADHDDHADDGPTASLGIWTWDIASPGVGASGADTLAAIVAGEESRLRALIDARRSAVFPTGADVPEAFRRAGVRSLVIVPLAKGRDAEGCLGVIVRQGDRPWTDGVLRRLRLLGDPLSGALLRRRQAATHDAGSRFERLLGELTAALLDGDETDGELATEDALQAIAEMAGADRAVLFRVRRGGTRLEPDGFWADDTLDPPRESDYRREASLRWLTRRLQGGEDVAIESVADLPATAARERRHFRRAGCRSVLRIPLRAGERVVAVLGVDATLAERSWTPEALERFRLAGRLLLWALDRGRGTGGGETVETMPAPFEPLPMGVAAGAAPWSGPPSAMPPGAAWTGPLGGMLPTLDRLPPGASVVVLGDAERGRELVLRLPLPGAGGGAAWEPGDAIEPAGALAPQPPVPSSPTGALPAAATPPADAEAPAHGTPTALRDVEREHLLAVLRQCGWKINGAGNAADRLGLKPSTLRSRMKKLGIERPGRAD